MALQYITQEDPDPKPMKSQAAWYSKPHARHWAAVASREIQLSFWCAAPNWCAIWMDSLENLPFVAETNSWPKLWFGSCMSSNSGMCWAETDLRECRVVGLAISPCSTTLPVKQVPSTNANRVPQRRGISSSGFWGSILVPCEASVAAKETEGDYLMHLSLPRTHRLRTAHGNEAQRVASLFHDM